MTIPRIFLSFILIQQCERYSEGERNVFAPVLHEQAGTSHTVLSPHGSLSKEKNRQASLLFSQLNKTLFKVTL